eukprot:2920632-Pyramimonas_sp.AAC.1
MAKQGQAMLKHLCIRPARAVLPLCSPNLDQVKTTPRARREDIQPARRRNAMASASGAHLSRSCGQRY